MKIIFMGTSEFAVPALEKISHSKHEVLLVFTKAPNKSGRGQKVQNSPIHEVAEKLGLNIITPKTLKNAEIQNTIRDLNPDIIVVTSYGHIVPQAILDIPKYGCLNIHPSLLPRWRGAAPIERTILAGDHETAVCIMKMDAGLDTGDILSIQNIKLDKSETAGSLTNDLSILGAEMLMKVLDDIETIQPIKQSEDGVTYAHKLDKKEGIIDWSHTAAELDCMIRAFNPWPGCFFKYKDEYIKILSAEINNDSPSGTPGEVLDEYITIACGQGSSLKPLELQKQGKKALKLRDFLNGNRIKKGTLL